MTEFCLHCKHYYDITPEQHKFFCSVLKKGKEYMSDMPNDWPYTDDPDTEKPTGYATSYYELPEWANELGDLIEYREMNFNVGNIFKAAYRLGEKKDTTVEYDLNKIIYFAERELARLKRQAS